MSTPTSTGRKKEPKSDFLQCQKCSTVLLPKDRDKHQKPNEPDSCQSSSGTGDDLGLTNTDYDFINGGRLIGTVRELQIKEDDLISELSMALRRQLLLASPFTLKQAGISVNDFIVVSNAQNYKSLRIAWPIMSAPIMAVCPVSPSEHFAPGSRVSVRRFEGKIFDALTVEVEQLTDHFVSDKRKLLLLEQLQRSNDSKVVNVGEVIRCHHYCQVYKFRIKSIQANRSDLEEAMAALSIGPGGDRGSQTDETFYRVTERTEFALRSPQNPAGHSATRLTFDDIGGLEQAKTTLKSLVNISPDALQHLASIGVRPIRRILISGPSGTGKSMLVEAFASQLNLDICSVTGQDLSTSEENPDGMKALLKKAGHCLVLLDNIDSLSGGKRENKDGFSRTNGFITALPDTSFVIATSSRIASLDERLRGIFDIEIETNAPKAEDRVQILQRLLGKFPNSLSPDDISTMSGLLHGYTGANLSCLVRQAVVSRLSRGQNSSVDLDDLRAASKVVTATPMREVILDIPKVYWSNIGGMDEVKRRLKKTVEWPLRHKADFRRMGIKPPSGLLMYGPPGCAKTMIAQALATESGLNFLAVKGPELFSKWVGDSERAVRDLFKQARAASPAIIFFDEIDAIATERKNSSGGSGVADRVLTQLLTEMDGVESLDDVIVIAATNRPDILDEALLRPGRLDSVVYVPLPDSGARREILEICFKKHPMAGDVPLEEIVDRTKGYSGAEIVAVMQEAAMVAYEQSMAPQDVQMQHIETALAVVTPRITAESISFYERFHQTFSKK